MNSTVEQMNTRPLFITNVFCRISLVHVAIVQGLYFFLGGIWPLLSMSSFVRLTGPKTDLWLVQTLGLLLAVMGIAFLVAGIRRHVTTELLLLAMGSSAALATIEILNVMAKRIAATYLLDSIVEIILIGLWVSMLIRDASGSECGKRTRSVLDESQGQAR